MSSWTNGANMWGPYKCEDMQTSQNGLKLDSLVEVVNLELKEYVGPL